MCKSNQNAAKDSAHKRSLRALTQCSKFLLPVSAPEIGSCLEHILCLTACTLTLLPQTMLAIGTTRINDTTKKFHIPHAVTQGLECTNSP